MQEPALNGRFLQYLEKYEFLIIILITFSFLYGRKFLLINMLLHV